MSEQEQNKLQASGMCPHGNEPGGCEKCTEQEIVNSDQLVDSFSRTLLSLPEGMIPGKYLRGRLV